jgi:hypothetical protein
MTASFQEKGIATKEAPLFIVNSSFFEIYDVGIH